jgi:hypothetical protein
MGITQPQVKLVILDDNGGETHLNLVSNGEIKNGQQDWTLLVLERVESTERLVTRQLSDVQVKDSLMSLLARVFTLFPEFNKVYDKDDEHPDPEKRLREQIESHVEWKMRRANEVEERWLCRYYAGTNIVTSPIAHIQPLSRSYLQITLQNGYIFKVRTWQPLEVLEV